MDTLGSNSDSIGIEDYELFLQAISGVLGQKISRVFAKTPTAKDLVRILGDGKDWYNHMDTYHPFVPQKETLSEKEQAKLNAAKSKIAKNITSILSKIKETIVDENKNDLEKQKNIAEYIINELDDLSGEERDILDECIMVLLKDEYPQTTKSKVTHKLTIKIAEVSTLQKIHENLESKLKEFKEFANLEKQKIASKQEYELHREHYNEQYGKVYEEFEQLSQGVETFNGSLLPKFPKSLSDESFPTVVLHRLLRLRTKLHESRERTKYPIQLIDNICKSHRLNNEEKKHLEEIKTGIHRHLLSQGIIIKLMSELKERYKS